MKYSLRSLMLASHTGEDFVYWFMNEWVPILLRSYCLIVLVYCIIVILRYYRQGQKQNAILTGIVAAILLVTLTRIIHHAELASTTSTRICREKQEFRSPKMLHPKVK